MVSIVNRLMVFIIMAFVMVVACNPDPSSEGDRDDQAQDEGVTQGMQDFWIEQRDKFIEGAEFQLEELEERLEEKENREKVNELSAELDNLRQRVSDIEKEGEFEWEDTRDEIAGDLIEIRREIEDME